MFISSKENSFQAYLKHLSYENVNIRSAMMVTPGNHRLFCCHPSIYLMEKRREENLQFETDVMQHGNLIKHRLSRGARKMKKKDDGGCWLI